MNAYENAQSGLTMLKSAIISTIQKHPEGIGNNDITRELGLESDFEGSQKNYLSWSIIGLLVNEGVVTYKKVGARKLYFIT